MSLNSLIPSLPVWEEWIEICLRRRPDKPAGLFPYGKSGLKFFLKSGQDPSTIIVSSRMGRVDWNDFVFANRDEAQRVSSRMGRVDWNLSPVYLILKRVVSSRMGRVDWNDAYPHHPHSEPVSSRMGRVDWNRLTPEYAFIIDRLFPYGKSGLKCFQRTKRCLDARLFPYGKSGLKLIDQQERIMI